MKLLIPLNIIEEVIVKDPYFAQLFVYYVEGISTINKENINGTSIDFYGNKFWYKNGKLHRIDGPAVESQSGYIEWWLNGERVPKFK